MNQIHKIINITSINSTNWTWEIIYMYIFMSIKRFTKLCVEIKNGQFSRAALYAPWTVETRK